MKPLKDIPARPEGEGRIGMNYKVADSRAEHIATKRKELLADLPRYRQMVAEYRDKVISGEEGKELRRKHGGQLSVDYHIEGIDKIIKMLDDTLEYNQKQNALRKTNNPVYSKEAVEAMGDINVSAMFNHEQDARTPYTNSGGHMAKYKGFEAYVEKQLTADYSKDTFYSALNQTVEKIFKTTVGKDEAINPARLLNLMKNASGGDIGRIMTEADAIGLTEFLKSKGQKKTSIKEIRDFIDTNKIEITVDPETVNVQADFGDTSSYRAKGDVQEYHTFVARINSPYEHGVSGHFGRKGDVVVHIRATIRVDAEGRKVLFVEEIQSQNAQAKQVPKHELVQIKKDLKVMEDYHSEMKAVQQAWDKMDWERKNLAHNIFKFRKDLKVVYDKYFPLLPESLRQKYNADKEAFITVNGEQVGESAYASTLRIGLDTLDDNGITQDRNFRMVYQEKKLKLARGESQGVNAPLQDFKETVKIASRTVMRQAVELGADRVAFVESKDTHPNVDMRKERGIQLYDKDIPAMVASDIKKFGGELKPANNFDPAAAQSDSGNGYPTEGKRTTHEILSRSRGYDVTPAMKETLNGQPTYKVADKAPARAEGTPDLKPFEGNFKVSDSVKSGVRTLGKFIDDNSDTANLSPDIKDAMKALREAVRKQDATDEILVPEVREAYDKIVEAVDRGIDTPALTPVAVLKELKKTLKPLNKEISKNSKDTAKRIADKDMAEGADLESDSIQEGQTAVRRDMQEGADIESEQALEKRDRQRGDNRLDQEEGADIEAEQAYERRDDYNRDQNESADLESSQPRKPVPSPFPYPAPPVPAGLPSYKPSGKPAFPRPPASPALPQVTPSNKPAFPRPPASPALPRGSIAPPPPQGTPAPDPFKNLPPSKPMGKLEGWRGWTLEKGLNGGFWKNAVGWMIIVQGDKFKVYNPQKAMEGIYNNLEQAKLRVRRAEPKDAITR